MSMNLLDFIKDFGDLIIAVLAPLGGLFLYFYKLHKWRRNMINNIGNIGDNDTLKLVKSHRFIQTMGQKDPPHETKIEKITKYIHIPNFMILFNRNLDENLGYNSEPEIIIENEYVAKDRFPLIKYILKEILNRKNRLDKKRFMILGGSGMGKSTFSAALYYKYINKYFYKKSPYPIYVKSLMDSSVFEDISKIVSSMNETDLKQSIIILDALDENFEASRDVYGFIERIEKATRDFRTVIITCRTQFFEKDESIPNKLTIKKPGGEKRTLDYDLIFISPFKKSEARKYLRKKYRFNILKYIKARKVSNKCSDILSRPMILSFIDVLLDIDDIDGITPFEIYSKIIDNWFDHEIEIQPISKSVLYSFSKEIALYILNKWKENESAALSSNEYNMFLDHHGINEDPYSFRSRSLINRTVGGDIKFSHKSIWEYFISINAFENPGIVKFRQGLDMAYEFTENLNYLICTGQDKRLSFPIESYKLEFYCSMNQKELLDKTSVMLEEKSDAVKKGRDFYLSLFELWEATLLSISNPLYYSIKEKEKQKHDAFNSKIFSLNRKLINAFMGFFQYFEKEKENDRLLALKNVIKEMHSMLKEYDAEIQDSNNYTYINLILPNENLLDCVLGGKVFIKNCGISDSFYTTTDALSYAEKLGANINMRPYIFITNDSLEDLVEVISLYRKSFISSILIITFWNFTFHFYLGEHVNSFNKKNLKNVLSNILTLKRLYASEEEPILSPLIIRDKINANLD